MKKLVLLFLVVFVLSSVTKAQFEDRITKLLGTELTNYSTPLATMTGTYFNSGGYYSASVSKLFGFKVSLIGMMIFIPDDQKTFKVNPYEGYNGEETSATFFGEKGAAIAGPTGFLVYPPGVNTSSIPAGIPQIAASTMGSEVMIRFLPTIAVEDVEANLFGFGLKHSISQYLPLVPVDIAVQFMYNKFSITSTDLDISTTNIAFNAHASKSLGPLIVYGGLQYESSSMDLDFIYQGDAAFGTSPGDKINLSLDGDNSFRVTIGAAVKLAVLVINADYNIGSQSAFVAGINFEI
jgi:hypothetical protein